MKILRAQNPLKQGLKQINTLINQLIEFTSRPESIKTRIETKLQPKKPTALKSFAPRIH